MKTSLCCTCEARITSVPILPATSVCPVLLSISRRAIHESTVLVNLSRACCLSLTSVPPSAGRITVSSQPLYDLNSRRPESAVRSSNHNTQDAGCLVPLAQNINGLPRCLSHGRTSRAWESTNHRPGLSCLSSSDLLVQCFSPIRKFRNQHSTR